MSFSDFLVVSLFVVVFEVTVVLYIDVVADFLSFVIFTLFFLTCCRFYVVVFLFASFFEVTIWFCMLVSILFFFNLALIFGGSILSFRIRLFLWLFIVVFLVVVFLYFWWLPREGIVVLCWRIEIGPNKMQNIKDLFNLI